MILPQEDTGGSVVGVCLGLWRVTTWVEEHTLTPLEESLRRRLRALTPASRARLLRLLNLPTAEPVTLIEALYTDSEFLALRHFLTDLEEDLPTLAAVVAELRRMERDEYLHSLGSGTMGRIHARS